MNNLISNYQNFNNNYVQNRIQHIYFRVILKKDNIINNENDKYQSLLEQLNEVDLVPFLYELGILAESYGLDFLTNNKEEYFIRLETLTPCLEALLSYKNNLCIYPNCNDMVLDFRDYFCHNHLQEDINHNKDDIETFFKNRKSELMELFNNYKKQENIYKYLCDEFDMSNKHFLFMSKYVDDIDCYFQVIKDDANLIEIELDTSNIDLDCFINAPSHMSEDSDNDKDSNYSGIDSDIDVDSDIDIKSNISRGELLEMIGIEKDEISVIKEQLKIRKERIELGEKEDNLEKTEQELQLDKEIEDETIALEKELEEAEHKYKDIVKKQREKKKMRELNKLERKNIEEDIIEDDITNKLKEKFLSHSSNNKNNLNQQVLNTKNQEEIKNKDNDEEESDEEFIENIISRIVNDKNDKNDEEEEESDEESDISSIDISQNELTSGDEEDS